jgi:predicted phage replisome organizer
MSKRYFWLKLKEDFFKSVAMRKLRKVAGGDTYTIIYLKMMLSCLNTDGVLFYEGIEDDISKELALILDEDPENVKITMNFLQQAGLLKYENAGDIRLKEVPILTGSETDKAGYMRNKRANEKLLTAENGNNVTALLPDVTECYTEKEKEREKDKEKEKERDKEEEKEEEKNIEEENKEIYKSKDKLLTSDCQQILNMYNEKCPSLPEAKKLTDFRARTIKARLKKYSLDDFAKVFEAAEQSSFLRGEKSSGEHSSWRADIDFLLKEKQFVKILEGGYKDFGPAKPVNKEADRLAQEYDRIMDWAESRSESSASDG